MFLRIVSLATLALSSGAFAESTIHSDYQCRALGNHFRVYFADRSEYLVESRIAFGLKLDKDRVGEAGEAKLSYIGHVAFQKFVEGGKQEIDLFDGYSQLLKKDHDSDLSPQASKYTDDKYFRFREVAESASTSQDGGGMNGYLVISKKVLSAEGKKKFSAHYVFQHGDHTGGTLDYVCQKQ